MEEEIDEYIELLTMAHLIHDKTNEEENIEALVRKIREEESEYSK